MYDEPGEPLSHSRKVRVYPREELRQGPVTNWANGHDPLRYTGEKLTVDEVLKFRETHGPFEPVAFPDSLPDRFEESTQYRILRDALVQLRAHGTKLRFVVPMMHDAVQRSRSSESSVEDFINESVVPEGDDNV